MLCVLLKKDQLLIRAVQKAIVANLILFSDFQTQFSIFPSHIFPHVAIK